MTQGTVNDYPNFNSEQDVQDLRKAMKGIGTDEKIIIHIIGTRSNAQRQKIKLDFATSFGKDLIKELKSELGGNFEDIVLALMTKPDDFDAVQVHNAMSGLGTDEKSLIEIICTRTNTEINELKAAYKRLYKKDVIKDVQGETSGCIKRLFTSLLQGARKENESLDHQKAAADAQALFNAGEGSWGTDESTFNMILASRSYAQLQLTFSEYTRLSKKTIEQAIKSEFSGDIQDGMMAIVKCAYDRPSYFAERLYHSMKGAGTNEKILNRVMASRSEKDMVQIKAAFQQKYGKSLASFIADDCSGDYKKILLVVCGQ